MDSQEPTRPPSSFPAGTDRRRFLRTGAAAGGLVWAAPAVLSVASATAQTSPPPPVCVCTADAFGLRVVIPPLGVDQTLGVDGCVADVALGVAGTATVAATAVCGTQTGCRAEASVATLDVVVGPVLVPTLRVRATVLTSQAAASCDPCGTTGDSNIASLVVNGIAVNVDSLTCNNDILNLGLVVFNEQTCTGERLMVNALHVLVPGVIEVIVAHTEAGATDCPCQACAD
ncbi:MAG: choice-of-anchor P family protein [Acidimicrobiales bacterium]